MSRILLEDTHFLIRFDEADNLCRIARTAVPFADTASCIRAHEAVAEATRGVPKGALATFDVRVAPSRNDPEFERVVTQLNARMFRPFERVAFLVKSAAGRLHVKRLTSNVSARVEVFVEEAAALVWLRAR